MSTLITVMTDNMSQWAFQDLVTWNQAQILLAIPKGQFNEAVFAAMDLALRWKAAQPKATK